MYICIYLFMLLNSYDAFLRRSFYQPKQRYFVGLWGITSTFLWTYFWYSNKVASQINCQWIFNSRKHCAKSKHTNCFSLDFVQIKNNAYVVSLKINRSTAGRQTSACVPPLKYGRLFSVFNCGVYGIMAFVLVLKSHVFVLYELHLSTLFKLYSDDITRQNISSL